MFTLAFWKATTERVVASFVGAVLALVGTNVFDVTTLDVGQLLKIGGGAALVSLLKAILAATTTGGGPSFTNAETLSDAVAAKVEPAVPSGAVAGEGSSIPEGTPVDVERAQEFDGMGAPISDPKRDTERGYWGGI